MVFCIYILSIYWYIFDNYLAVNGSHMSVISFPMCLLGSGDFLVAHVLLCKYHFVVNFDI